MNDALSNNRRIINSNDCSFNWIELPCSIDSGRALVTNAESRMVFSCQQQYTCISGRHRHESNNDCSKCDKTHSIVNIYADMCGHALSDVGPSEIIHV